MHGISPTEIAYMRSIGMRIGAQGGGLTLAETPPFGIFGTTIRPSCAIESGFEYADGFALRWLRCGSLPLAFDLVLVLLLRWSWMWTDTI